MPIGAQDVRSPKQAPKAKGKEKNDVSLFWVRPCRLAFKRPEPLLRSTMSNGAFRRLLLTAFVTASCSALALSARAENRVNNWHRLLTEREFAERIAKSIVNAARPTGKGFEFDRHELKPVEGKDNRKVLNIRATFKGAVTGKDYLADFDVELDTGREWEIVDIRYHDNDSVKVDPQNLITVRRALNKEIEK
jgi:hypothetical protein